MQQIQVLLFRTFQIFFFFYIFNPWLAESINAEPGDMENFVHVCVCVSVCICIERHIAIDISRKERRRKRKCVR